MFSNPRNRVGRGESGLISRCSLGYLQVFFGVFVGVLWYSGGVPMNGMQRESAPFMIMTELLYLPNGRLILSVGSCYFAVTRKASKCYRTHYQESAWGKHPNNSLLPGKQEEQE